MWPALIAAGASIAGSLLQKEATEEAADKNAALQREFAQSGIQWKVADAKAAGVHPLFALGASTASASPVYSAPNYAEMGQNVSRAALAHQAAEVQERQLQLQEKTAAASAERDLAQAQYYGSLAARTQQENQIGIVAPGGTYSFPVKDRQAGIIAREEMDVPMFGGMSGGTFRERRAKAATLGDTWTYDPNKVPTARPSNPGIGAGPGKPLFDDFILPMSVRFPSEYGYTDVHPRILLPQGSSASEAIESLSEGGTSSPMFAAIAAINIQHYGKEYWDLIVQAMRNKAPRWYEHAGRPGRYGSSWFNK